MRDLPSTDEQNQPAPELHWTPEQGKQWRKAILLAVILLSTLGWLLAKLVWLPFYFGLFFFLVAGLLVGAAAFRFCHSARPISKRRLALGVCFVSLISILVVVCWEYQHIAGTRGGPPKFPRARNAAIAADRSPRSVQLTVADAFKDRLRADFAPGGVIGYVRWATASGEMEISLGDETETVSIPQSGWAWPIRTVGGLILLAMGLWFSLESLLVAERVTNILAPGEEAEDEDS